MRTRPSSFEKAVASVCAIAMMSFAFLPSGARAQEFPSRPIRLVVGFSPGSGIDIVARILAQKISKSLPQSVIVENKPGAGGNIGADAVAKSAPDGYTLYFTGVGSAVISFHLLKKMPYKYEDLVPVTLVGMVPLVVIVSPKRGYGSLEDLVKAAKARPGALNYGSAGIGTVNHMSSELFKKVANIDAVHVPYKGGAESNRALIAGTVDFNFDPITTASSYIKAGTVRALAVTTKSRSPIIPDVPSISELGYPEFETTIWYGVQAPAQTPAAIIQKLNAEFVRAIREPEIEKRLTGMGLILRATSAEEAKKFIDGQYQTIGALVKAIGIEAE